MYPMALFGGVSRPSRSACTATGTPARATMRVSAAMWSWWACTPPGDSNPIRWQVPALAARLSARRPRTGLCARVAVGQGGVNARQILDHYPPGADIHMPDFGIAHLAGRQPDVAGGGVEEGVGALRHKLVPGRRLGQRDGVVVALGARPPAVQDAQHDGARRRPLGYGFGHGANICRNRPAAIVGRGAGSYSR